MEDQGCLACTRCRKRPLATNGREFRNLILVKNGDSVVQCWRSLSQSTNTDGTNRQTRRGIRRNAPITSVDGLLASCQCNGRPLRTHWGPDRESNPGARICSPLRHHSAIGPRRARRRNAAGRALCQHFYSISTRGRLACARWRDTSAGREQVYCTAKTAMRQGWQDEAQLD